jgi:excisionase family DNA binding protein
MTDDVMTIGEVAAALRCSKAHVYNAINGKVRGVGPLPAITMGRRKLVRRASLEEWKEFNESGRPRGAILLPSPEVDAVRRA